MESSGNSIEALDTRLLEFGEINSVTGNNLIELDSSSSPLSNLDLAAQSMRQEELGYVLRAPKALKTFSFKLCSPWNLDFADLRDALAPQKDYLESLGLDYHEEADFMRRRRDIVVYAHIASFISFSALKVFKTNGLFLTTPSTERHILINIFPLSLETLHLTNIESCPALKAVEHLLAQKSPQQIPLLPLLKKLILENTGYNGMELIKLVDQRLKFRKVIPVRRLSSVAAAHGVSIKLRMA